MKRTCHRRAAPVASAAIMPKSPVWPFIAPFVLFMIILTIEGSFPDQHYVIYPIKTLLVGAVILAYGRSLPSLQPASPWLSALVGVIGVVLWVGLDPWANECNELLGGLFNRVVSAVGLSSWRMPDASPIIGRNPFLLYPVDLAWVLFAFRVLGISLCVPIMEELFWRGFLMRWLIREDFTNVPLGTYQAVSFWVTTACFASVHGSEWLLAVVVGVIYGAWFVRTKSLGSVMLAHGVTNLLLAFYCLETNDWHFLSTVSTGHEPR
jgi:CAAX prenyl protease-like protein